MDELYVNMYNTVFEIVSTEIYTDENMPTSALYGQHMETRSVYKHQLRNKSTSEG